MPNNPELIRTNSQYAYPIIDNAIAKEFLEEVSQRYRIRFPIFDHIMQANPTDKPDLPTDSQELAKLNITLPITTPQQLTQIAKTLCQHFYFKQLPPLWINITNPIVQTAEQEDNADSSNKSIQTAQVLPPLPNSIEEVNSALTQNNIQLTLPITLQSEITPTMQILRQHYTICTIPDFLLNLPPLPTPTWEIFNTPTITPNEPPTTNTVAMDIS